MRTDGIRRLMQLVRDTAAVQPADHQAQHLVLARRQLRDQRRSPRRVAVLSDQLAEQFVWQPAAAKHRGPYRANDLLDRGVLGQEAHRARPDRVQRHGHVGVGGEYHDRGRERQGGHLPGEVDTAHLTQAQIHDHHVRPPRRDDTEGLIRVADRHRLEVRFCREDGL